MRVTPSCPRCGEGLHPPGPWSSAWRCGRHGDVLPLQPPRRPSQAGLEAILRVARVPVWLPWPLPTGWLVTGFADAGDDRTGARACAVALSGPSFIDGPADLVVVSEEPGIGLGAGLSGTAAADPGEGFDSGVPHAKIEVKGRPAPLWHVDTPPDHAAYVGEALGRWLWLIAWPAEAGCLVALEGLTLRDLRDQDQDLDLPFGATSPRLV